MTTNTSDVSNESSRRCNLGPFGVMYHQLGSLSKEKAHRIVEQLVLDDVVTREFLTVSVGFITPSHYADVTVERSISGVCGYPLCNNHLSQVVKQQYKISTKTNRVYDITERKHFCSNVCFKASKYLESQIPTSPVWTRDNDRLEIKLLEKGDDYRSHRLGAGELIVGVEEAPLDVENERSCNCSSETERGLLPQRKRDDGRHCNETTETSKEKKLSSELNEKQNHTSVNRLPAEVGDTSDACKTGRTQDNITNLPCDERMGNVDRDPGVLSPFETADTTDTSTTANVQENRSDQPPVEFIGNVERDIVSCQRNKEKGKSLEQSIFEPHATSKVFNDDAHDIDLSQQSISPRQLIVRSLVMLLRQWSTLSTLEYLHLVHHPNYRNRNSHNEEKQGSADQELKSSISGSEMEDFTKKMRQFFTHCGDDSEDEEVEDKISVAKKVAESDIVVKERKSEESALVIPLIDSKSQMTIRRRIVLRKLAQILPGMLQEIRLTVAEISGDLTELVHTFSLSSRNVVLKPSQWNVLAVLLVYMLKNHNASVENSLRHCKDNFLGLLRRLGITRHDLDRILAEVYQTEVSTPDKLSSKAKEETPWSKSLTNYGEMEELD